MPPDDRNRRHVKVMQSKNRRCVHYLSEGYLLKNAKVSGTVPGIVPAGFELMAFEYLGGTGGSGGPGVQGGAGGNAEGPQFTVSGARNWNVTVQGDLRISSDARKHSLGTPRQKDPKPCPLPVSSFTGRKDILEKMHQHFDSNPGSQRVFVLYGLGGSGKSQLAFKFLQDSQAPTKHFSDIFYIDATSEQTIETDLKDIVP
ncbi:hypothetical protein B0H12DRAFT_1217997 [Mycena haematopus]|nr:hypothetical protein B0H12DRAFT_1217997 [Mycena haematopus]